MKEKKQPKLKVPTVGTIAKLVQEHRAIAAVDEQWKPWDVMSLAKFPISPEAIPLIMDIYEGREKTGDPLKIREAVWIGRLYRLYDNRMTMDHFLEIIQDCVSREMVEMHHARYRAPKKEGK